MFLEYEMTGTNMFSLNKVCVAGWPDTIAQVVAQGSSTGRLLQGADNSLPTSAQLYRPHTTRRRRLTADY